MDHTSLENP